MNKKRSLVVFILIIVYGCTAIVEQNEDEKQLKLQRDVFSQLIPNLLDSLVKKHDAISNIFISHEVYPDNLKSNSINNFLSEYEGSQSLKISLSEKLSRNINDSVFVWNLKSTKTKLLVGHKVDSLLKNNLPFFAQINLSNIKFSDDMTSGVFYFAYQCGSDCGEGSIVFIKKSNDNEKSWSIEQKLLLWK